MYISTNLTEYKNGSIRSLSNIDYYKRYIIIEPNSDGSQSITVVNISSNTGRSKMGINRDSERNQITNLYLCKGYVLNGIPKDKLTAKAALNLDSVISVEDISYGVHNYDLNRQRFGELVTSTSYVDMYHDDVKFSLAPNIGFYNNEHHVLNQEVAQTEFTGGANFITRKNMLVEVVQLRELIDDHTTIMFTNQSNFNKFESYSPGQSLQDGFCFESAWEEGQMVDMNFLTLMIVGPVTDLILGLMYNYVDFSYDSHDGMSRINFKTNHKQPNSIYLEQINGNCISEFQSAMQYVYDEVGWRFRLFVKSSLGNLTMKIFSYDTHNGGFVTKDFELDVGRFRNEQHFDSIHWIESPCGVPASCR